MATAIPKGFKPYVEGDSSAPQGFKPYVEAAPTAPQGGGATGGWGDDTPAKPDRPSTTTRPAKAQQPQAKPSTLDRLGQDIKQWVQGSQETTTGRYSSAATRGLAPYVAAGAAGAALGAPLGGVGALPGAAAGVTAAGLADLGVAAWNQGIRPLVNTAAGREVVQPSPSTKDLTDALLDKLGLAKSTTPGQRMVEAVAGGLAGGGAGNVSAKTLAPLAERIPAGLGGYVNALAQGGAGGSAISGAASALGAQGAAEMGGGPLAQFGASMLAAAIPAMAGGAFRGVTGAKSPQDIAAMKQRVQQAREMGIDPTLGQVGGTTATNALEKVARGTSPGKERVGRITDTLENRVKDIVKATGSDLTPRQASKAVTGLGSATNPDTAGRVLQKSLGKEWLDRVKPVEDAVWERWEGKANSKPAAMPNTIEFLNRRLEPIPGAEASSAGVLDNRTLRNIHHNMIVDMDASGSQAMPYQYLKDTRSWIGDSLDPKRLTADTSIKDLKALYAAMSQDMEAHAKSIGPDAVRDFKRANALTKAKMNRVETYLQKIQGKEPGEVWRYASSPDAVEGGGHRFLTLNRSLAPDERPMFHSTFINEMGRKPNGEFDPLQFSENYKRLSPGVRDVLFPGAKGEAAAKVVNFIDQLNAQGTFSKGGMNLPQNLAGYLLMSSIMHASPGKLAKGLVGLSKMESVVNFMSKPWVINFVANENRLPPAAVARIFYAARQAMETQKRMEKQQKEGDDQDYMAVLQQAAQRYGAGQGAPGALPGGAPAADSYDAVLQGVMQGGGGYEGGDEGGDE